jgi:hypothetical protein
MTDIVKDPDKTWQSFIEGPLHASAHTPWHDDQAFAVIADHPGLRDSIGGPVTPVVTMAIKLVQAMTQVDLMQVVHAHRPVQGLCLGFGMNALEPYDLQQVFELDCVHGYEWIGEQVVEAAQLLQTLHTEDPLLPTRIRLHHGTLSDLSAIADTSMQVIYTANVFTREVPMTSRTFEGAMREILRVLADDGVLFSRGSAGVLEEHLARHGRMLLPSPLVSVFQKRKTENSHERTPQRIRQRIS